VEVLREIFMLRDYYDRIHPHDSAPWTGVAR